MYIKWHFFRKRRVASAQTLNRYGKKWWIRSRCDLSLTARCISVKYCSAFTKLYGVISPHWVSHIDFSTSQNSASSSAVKCPSATNFLANTWKSSYEITPSLLMSSKLCNVRIFRRQNSVSPCRTWNQTANFNIYLWCCDKIAEP